MDAYEASLQVDLEVGDDEDDDGAGEGREYLEGHKAGRILKLLAEPK